MPPFDISEQLRDKYRHEPSERLVARYARAESKAEQRDLLTALYDRYRAWTFAYLYNKTRKDDTLAHELFAEVTDKLLATLEKIRLGALNRHGKPYAIGNFNAWIARVARNALIDHYKKNPDAGMEFEPPERLADENEPDERRELAVLALGLLNDERRECLQAVYVRQLSYQETVQLTGYTRREVTSHVQGGKNEVRRRVEAALPPLQMESERSEEAFRTALQALSLPESLEEDEHRVLPLALSLFEEPERGLLVGYLAEGKDLLDLTTDFPQVNARRTLKSALDALGRMVEIRRETNGLAFED